MNIRNEPSKEELGRAISRLEDRRERERAARPDAIHRAIHFLMQQIVQNNRDATPEARHHMETLDRELGNPEALAEQEPQPAAAASTSTGNTEQPAAPIKVSKRFRRSNTATE